MNLRLFDIEVLIFENKLNQAEKLLNNLFKLEPNNEELYIQKANIFLKEITTSKLLKYLKKH